MKVCKFGGTSMATAKSIRQVEKIIRSDPERKYVVVSAPGKRFKGDIKVTDLLYQADAEKAHYGCAGPAIEEIRDRFVTLVAELGLDMDMDRYIDEVEAGINASSGSDYAASRGEYLSAIVLSELLGFDFVDAADIIKFKHDGSFDADNTNDLVQELKKNTKGIVIPGFYGSMPDGSIKTFSRGGSDVSGAIIARGVGAAIYENWTDVNGFMVTDPNVVQNPKQMEVLSYEELRELSYMGASVLHPDSIFPVREDGIPINIRNTFEPENKGTMILPDISGYPKSSIVTGIAGRKGNTTISLKKAMMNSELGFGRKVLSVLERHGISFEHMPTGIDTMSIVITEKVLNGVESQVIEDIKGKVNPDSIEVIHNLALIAVVGHGMANQMGTAARIFVALYQAGVNIRMIDQGSSEMNIIIGVEEKDYEKAIKAIYSAFFE
jgi:aspartate kinase